MNLSFNLHFKYHESVPIFSTKLPSIAIILSKIGLPFCLYFLTLFAVKALPVLVNHPELSYFVYLPAGIKVLSVLIFGWTAAIGIGLAVFIRLLIFQPEQSWVIWFAVALVGSTVLVLVVSLTLKGLGVSRDLHNLKYRDVVTLALLASIAHGFSYTYVIFATHNYIFENFIRESMIIVMGGFFGNMLIIGLLTFAVQHSAWLQNQIKRLNQGEREE
jgi:hypothetical protein